MLHPNQIRVETIRAEERLTDLQRKYDNGSPAMKMYLGPELRSATKTLNKWRSK